MPNYCINILNVTSYSDSEDAYEQLNRFSALFGEEDGEDVDFIDKLIPMPKDYESNNAEGDESEQWHSKMLELHGASDWYDWAIKNWGTKGGASSTEKFVGYHHSIMIRYYTPWGPANTALVTISRLFPLLQFENFCSEQGAHVHGYIDVVNGEIRYDSEQI